MQKYRYRLLAMKNNGIGPKNAYRSSSNQVIFLIPGPELTIVQRTYRYFGYLLQVILRKSLVCCS